MVGCNTYLTPKGAQGFAPHYDDIEVGGRLHQPLQCLSRLVPAYHSDSSKVYPLGFHSAVGRREALACVRQPQRRATAAHVIP